MSSRWTNKNAILRDLSLAQGFEVPVDLDSTLAAGDRPPALSIVEDNEEEFFNNCNMMFGEDIETTTAPDISLIQHMLKMVQLNPSDSEDDNAVVEVSKPPEHTCCINKVEPSIVKSQENKISETKVLKKTKRRRENVAVNSILQGILDSKAVPEPNIKQKTETLKLLKPTDFIPNGYDTGGSSSRTNSLVNSPENPTRETTSIDKVTGWLSQHYSSSLITEQKQQINGYPDSWKSNGSDQSKNNNKSKLLVLEPTAMFKKKNVAVKSVDSDSVKSSPVKKSETQVTTSMYQPSTLADEYYQRFVERSKLNEVIKQDVWTRAERVMKEIDEKKKTEEIAPVSVSQQQMNSATNVDEIRLPQHRHLLTEDCVVCETVQKNGIDVDLEILHDTKSDINWLPGALKVNSWRKKI